ncbi:MAG: glycosyltransferase family 4 protein [Saprospiraceae bacterium]|nr:glycosyltransferase family 4 protein [Saprospiraceae bacterium]
MRILILSIEYPPLGGGASPMIHEISKQYVKFGHEVTVITMAHGQLPLHENVEGVDVHRVHSYRAQTHISHFHEHLAYIYAARVYLKKMLKHQTFDVCHTHFLVPTGLLARWVKRKYHIPYIITSQGSDVPGYNPDRFHFLHKLTPPLIRSVIRESACVVAPSQYLRSLIIKVSPADHAKVFQIPSGIDTDYYMPGPKKPIVLSTGRLLPRKGFQYLIEAVADEVFPFEVHICGDGPMMNDLKEKAKQSATPVFFHGWLDNKSEAYKVLLSEAMIFSLVSAKENASTSLMEALSAGCAVITSDVSGCPESVGDAGICIPPADARALKDKLKALMNDPDLMVSLMHAGRARAIREFSWPSITRGYLALFEKLLKP